MRSDRELIALYQAGDEESFREFYGRHRKPLYVYLLSIVRDRETAEELLQETFFAFLRSLGRLNGSDDLRPYLVRTARNRAIDFLRRARRGEEALLQRAQDPFFKPRGEGEAGTSGAGTSGTEGMERVEFLLQRLPPDQREAIMLKVFLGMTYKEIGRITSSPEGSAVSRYRYGMEKLRAALAARGGCDEGIRRPAPL